MKPPYYILPRPAYLMDAYTWYSNGHVHVRLRQLFKKKYGYVINSNDHFFIYLSSVRKVN